MLRFRPDVKPPMWGPPDAIAFAVRSNAEREGLDPSKILGYWPVFEAGGNKIFSLFGGDKETFAITSGDFEPNVVKNAVLACATSKAKEAHTQLSGVLLMSKMTLSEQYLLTTRSTYNNLYGFTFYVLNGVYLSVRYSSGGSYVTVSSYDMRGKSFTQPFMIGFSFDAGAFTFAYNENRTNASGVQSSMAASPSNLAMGMTAATLHGCLLTKQAVPARVFDTFYYEPYKLLMPVARPLYFDLGATAGIDALTALDLVTGSPVLGTPALGQTHVLTATGLITSAPVPGAPAVGQVHVSTVNDLLVGSPVLGPAELAQAHVLTASDLTVVSPALGTPVLSLFSSVGFHALMINPGIRWQWVYAVDDTGETDAATTASGNVLTEDVAVSKAVSQVNGSAANVGVAVAGSNGGTFTIASDGSWTFNPAGDFALLSGSETADTSVTYHASDGTAEDEGTLTVTVSAASAPALWTPVEITTAIWVDASDNTTVSLNGSTVAQRDDKSGNARHIAQATASLQPTATGSGQNGLDVDTFANDNLATASSFPITGNAAFSVFWVHSKTTANQGCVWGWGNIGVALQAVGFYDDGSTAGIAFAGSNFFKTASPALGYNQWGYVKSAGAIDATSLLTKNGVNAGTSGHSSATPNIASGQLYVGQWATYTANKLYGSVGELIVVPTAVDATTRQKIEGYLAHRWGLTANLPAEHPYKTTPPSI